jgi:uncharacterized protein
LLEKNGVQCLFHTLNFRMVFGGSVLRDVFEAFSKPARTQDVSARLAPVHSAGILRQVIADLSEKGLLLQGPGDDAREYRRQYHRARNQYRIQHMYLLPTNACNFRCTYCFVEDDERHAKPCFMDIPTAEMALTAFARLTKESGHANVTFYGGEPLLNPAVTFYSLRRLRELEAEGKLGTVGYFAVLTNGSLVNATAISVFQETKPTVSVSIDGPQILHDSARVDEHGRGTFLAALAGYRKLQDAGLKPGVSCTLNALTIDRIDEIVDFMIDDLKPAGMGFNLLLPQIACKQGGPAFDHEFAAHQLVKAFLRLREAGIYEDRVMRRVRPFVSQQLHCKDCMGVGGQIVVTPSGRVGPCQAFLGVDDEKYFPLDIRRLAAADDQVSAAAIYADPLFGEWRERFPLNMKECADCFAISVCGGGCPYAAAVTDGSIWHVDGRVCHQAKTIFEWMIWDAHSNMKKG